MIIIFSDNVLQVEFEARGPEEEDYHGIRRLLQQLFLKNSVVNISKVAETILGEISSRLVLLLPNDQMMTLYFRSPDI